MSQDKEQSVIADATDHSWVASRRRSNVILAIVLALVAVGFFCSAWLIDFSG